MLERLQDENGRALAKHEPVAIGIEWARGCGRLLVEGRAERAKSAKSRRGRQVYTGIERSSTILIFLSKTYFTRKWCVKEFQEAIATGKHVVIVLDTDARHGGMTLDAFVEYSTGQRTRAGADAATGLTSSWKSSSLSS